MGQLRLLLLLRREGPQPMGRLAEIFDLSPTASSGFVDCELTEAGIHFLQELSGDRIETVRVALAALDATELTEFRRLLRRILEHQEEPA